MRKPVPSAETAALAVIALSALLLVALVGSAAAKSKPRSLQQRTPGLVESLAMDGSRIAYDVAGTYGSRTRCNEVYVWNVARKVTRRVSGRQTCGADNSSTGAGVRALAVAGGRVAWIVNQGGNSESGDHLYVSSVAGPHERVLASAFRTGSVDGILTGNWLGGLVGSQSFLGVDHWSTDTNGAVTRARLQRVGARLGDLAEAQGRCSRSRPTAGWSPSCATTTRSASTRRAERCCARSRPDTTRRRSPFAATTSPFSPPPTRSRSTTRTRAGA